MFARRLGSDSCNSMFMPCRSLFGTVTLWEGVVFLHRWVFRFLPTVCHHSGCLLLHDTFSAFKFSILFINCEWGGRWNTWKNWGKCLHKNWRRCMLLTALAFVARGSVKKKKKESALGEKITLTCQCLSLQCIFSCSASECFPFPPHFLLFHHELPLRCPSLVQSLLPPQSCICCTLRGKIA